jgi:hypothetical protein
LGSGFFPIRPGHFFAPVHATAPVFVHAPVAVNRPAGPFVIFGHPGFQTIVPVTAAPATTTAPATEAPTTAAPATTAARLFLHQLLQPTTTSNTECLTPHLESILATVRTEMVKIQYSTENI